MVTHRRIWLYLAALAAALVFSLVWAGVASAQSADPPPPPLPAQGETAPSPPPVPLPEAGDEDNPGAEGLAIQADPPPDPWFMVGATQRTFGTIQGALDAIKNEGIIPTDRAVHVDAGIYPEAIVIVDGTDRFLGQLQKLEGNCNSVTRVCDISDATRTELRGSLSVHDTKIGFTLQGMTIKGGVTFTNNTGALLLRNLVVANPGGNGITVDQQKGVITMDGVKASGNVGYGAHLDNTAVIAPVTIRSSAFDGNAVGAGAAIRSALVIQTRGPVLIDGISVNNNVGDGLYLETPSTLTLRNSRIENNQQLESGGTVYADGNGVRVSAGVLPISIVMDTVYADGNAGDGMILRSKSVISLNNLTVNKNAWNGLIVCGTDPCGSSYPGATSLLVQNSAFIGNHSGAYFVVKGPVTLLNDAFFSNTGGNGLEIHASSTVTFNHVMANDNVGYGAYVIILGMGVHGNLIALNSLGDNQFNGNRDGTGLWASVQGSILLTDVNANGNSDYGLRLDTDWIYGLGIMLTRVWANDNGRTGANIDARGAILWTNGGASDNGQDTGSPIGGGADIDNENMPYNPPVTLSNVGFNGNLDGDGLEVYSSGAITITDLNSASFNAGDGVYLNNRSGPAPVSINRTRPFGMNETSGNADAGLVIITKGAVTLNRIAANNNGEDGAYVSNCVVSGPLALCSNVSGPVTLTSGPEWVNEFSGNGYYGLRISSAGGVSVSRVVANGNDYDGISISSVGSQTLLNIGAVENGEDGADLYSQSGAVSISATPNWMNELSRNTDYGLWVSAYGAIFTSRIDASDNGWIGADLHNFANGAPVTVMSGRFENNNGDGLEVNTYGAIFVTGINASGNSWGGAVLNNYFVGAPVMVTGGRFDNNHDGDGLSVYSRGAITVTDVDASNNDLANSWLDLPETINDRLIESRALSGDAYKFSVSATQASSPVRIELQLSFTAVLRLYRWDEAGMTYVFVNQWNGSASTPIDVSPTLSEGEYRLVIVGNTLSQFGNYSVSLNDHDKNNDESDGAVGVRLTNLYTTATASVTMRRSSVLINSELNNNSGGGLVIRSRGAILVNNVRANGNGWRGGLLQNDSNPIAQPVTVGSTVIWSEFNGNGGEGLLVRTRGAITITNTDGCENAGTGVDLDNQAGIAGVTYRSTSPFIINAVGGNSGNGLIIYSRGIILLDRISADYNAEGGAVIYNMGAPGPASATVLNSSFSNNLSHTGLVVASRGAIVANTVTARDNGTDDQGQFVGTVNGALLDNAAGGLIQPVIIINSGFDHNSGNGLMVYSRGNISASNLAANLNGQNGAVMMNVYTGSPGTVTVTGVGEKTSFFVNGMAGLVILSNKTIFVNQIIVEGNGTDGIYLRSSSGSITVANTITQENGQNGIYAESLSGSILLNNMKIFNNGRNSGSDPLIGNGAYLYAANGNIWVSNSAIVGHPFAGIRYYVVAGKNLFLFNNVFAANNLDGTLPGMGDVYKE